MAKMAPCDGKQPLVLTGNERDIIGDLAYLITGCIAATCCHRTGGYNSDPKCECRDIAITLIDNKERVLEILRVHG